MCTTNVLATHRLNENLFTKHPTVDESSLRNASCNNWSVALVAKACVRIFTSPIRSVRSQRTLRPAPAAGQIWKCSLRFGAFSDSNLQFQCGSVAIARGAGPREVSTIESRFPRETFVEGSEEITIVRPRDASSKPRLPLFALLKAFAPSYSPCRLFYERG